MPLINKMQNKPPQDPIPQAELRVYKKNLIESTSKSYQKLKTKTHFENGFACLKNTILVGSKDSIREGEKRSHLELAKQEEGRKI